MQSRSRDETKRLNYNNVNTSSLLIKTLAVTIGDGGIYA